MIRLYVDPPAYEAGKLIRENRITISEYYRIAVVTLLLINLSTYQPILCLYAESDFLLVNTGARAAGMGGAFCALADDINAVYWNPAGLGHIRWEEFAFMHRWYRDEIYEFGAYCQPIEELDGNIGESIYYMSKSSDNYNLAAVLSWGQQIMGVESREHNIPGSESLNVGINLKFMREEIYDVRKDKYAVDIGGLYKFQEDRISFGTVLQNIGAGKEYVNTKIGAGYRILNKDSVLTIDVNFPYGRTYASAGAEYWLFDIFALRCGYTTLGDTNGLRCGLGYGRESLKINYAVIPSGESKDTHYAGISYRFGGLFKTGVVQAKIEKHFIQGKRFYRHNDLISAYREFQDVLFLNSEHEGAKEYLDKIRTVKKDIQMSRHFQAGKKYYQLGKLLKAKYEFESIIKVVPDNKETKNYLEMIEEKFEKMTEADALFRHGINSYEKGDYQKALDYWEAVAVVDKDYPEINNYIARSSDKIETMRKKKKEQERQRKEQEKNEKIKLHYEKGKDFYSQKKWDDSAKQFMAVLDIEPSHKSSKKYLEKIKYSVAEDLYDKAENLYNEKKYKESVNYFQETLKVIPDYRDSEELIRKITAEMKEYNLKKADELYERGLEAYKNGRIDKAIGLWKQAVDLNPNHLPAKKALQRIENETE
ncbi:MAG: tetratricopeptide repeat protein [Elusimicrobia bacterium]|nr:tetratricopeptide repeat protein [Elusimicrobiota bacterium]